jgi:alpha,alpha-trehalose phosphorylase
VWSALACGFGGMRDHEGVVSIDPRLPEVWDGLTYRLTVRGVRVRVDVRHTELRLTVEEGDAITLVVRGERVEVTAAGPAVVPLAPAPRLIGTPTVRDIEGNRRADGTLMTASVPDHPTVLTPPPALPQG